MLRYMQDIESHTIVYVRQLLAPARSTTRKWRPSSRAGSRGDVPRHGARSVPRGGGHRSPRRARAPTSTLRARLEEAAIALLSRAPGPISSQCTWPGAAINELTTLTGYRRLAAVARHPVLSELLDRIIRDESAPLLLLQAGGRARRPGVAHVTRFLVERSGRRSAPACSPPTSCASSARLARPPGGAGGGAQG